MLRDDGDGELHGAEFFWKSHPVAQLVKKCPQFCGTRRFITVFTRARHLPLSWARWIHFMLSLLYFWFYAGV